MNLLCQNKPTSFMLMHWILITIPFLLYIHTYINTGWGRVSYLTQSYLHRTLSHIHKGENRCNKKRKRERERENRNDIYAKYELTLHPYNALHTNPFFPNFLMWFLILTTKKKSLNMQTWKWKTYIKQGYTVLYINFSSKRSIGTRLS